MKHTMKFVKTAIDILLIVLVAALALLTIAMVALRWGGNGQLLIGGVGFGRVVTGSMEPTIPVGSFVLVHEVDPDEVVVGDVLMFTSDDPTVPDGYPVTHRVIDIDTNEQGEHTFITKGDANDTADEYPVFAEDIIGVITASSTLLGAVIGFSQQPYIYPILIGLLAVDLVMNIVIVSKQAKAYQHTSKEEK